MAILNAGLKARSTRLHKNQKMLQRCACYFDFFFGSPNVVVPIWPVTLASTF